MLQSFTRGNVSPLGKQKIYLTGHPQERDKYFGMVSNWFLGQFDCAIWYDDGRPLEESSGEQPILPDGTLLVAIPVTAAFLEGRGAEKAFAELKYAVKNHIPVLPLMMESEGYIDEFEMIFGKTQYLCPGQTDATGLSFERKLYDYLNEILVSESEKQEIASEFDSRIFMSYRKKDRAYVTELMKLIHNDPLCRDVAIWYDEYLTPGVRYDDEIRQALLSGSIFVLAITPNLLCERNYVMDVELPMAMKYDISILPVELVSTELEFFRKIPGFPKVQELQDIAGVSLRVCELIDQAKMKRRDSRHDYLMGLAYLSGIQVEQDTKRALQLITSAAERGNIAAAEKLVALYINGRNVEPNPLQALHWQRRLTELWEAKLSENPTVENAKELLKNLNLLGNYATDLGNQNQIPSIYNRILSVAAKMPDSEKAVTLKYQVHAYYNLGLWYHAAHDWEQAMKYYGQVIECSRKWGRLEEALEVYRSFFIGLVKVGDILFERDNPNMQKAYDQFQEALVMARELVNDYPCNDTRRDLAGVYERFGDLFLRVRDPQKALEYYEKASEMAVQIYKEQPTIQNCRTVALRFDRLANCEEELGWFGNALVTYRKAANARKRIFDRCKPFGDQYAIKQCAGLARNYFNAGSAAHAEYQLEEAKALLQACLDVISINDGPKTGEEQQMIAQCMAYLEDIRKDQS